MQNNKINKKHISTKNSYKHSQSTETCYSKKKKEKHSIEHKKGGAHTIN